MLLGVGGAWYTLSAMRVVNQALGRVIRHKDDFGAILLADERFARGDMQKNISYWARQLMTVRSEFGDLQGDLKNFFDENEKSAPPRLKKKFQSGAVLGEVCGHYKSIPHAVYMLQQLFNSCVLNMSSEYAYRVKWHGSIRRLLQTQSDVPLTLPSLLA